MQKSPRKIIIDTDPGQDDALAILLALAAPELDVLGICTVHGNVPLEKTTYNARCIVELAGKEDETPIYAGCSRPILADAITAEEVHGVNGLESWNPPIPKTPIAKEHAVDFIIETVANNPKNSITICTIGPLTNLALAFIKAPEIMKNLEEIVIMGGAFFFMGNSSPVAEWNILVDPHAAEIVLKSGVDIVMMPLDVTHKAMTTPKRLARFAAIEGEIGKATAAMLSFYGRYDEEKYDIEGCPLHDPCTIAYLIKPELFSGKKVSVRVEYNEGITFGMTVMDWWQVTTEIPNSMVMQEIDDRSFYNLIIENLTDLAKSISANEKNI